MKKQFIIAVILAIVCPVTPLFADADQQNIIIVELQTGQEGEPGNDFIEFYNPNTHEVDVTGWRLQYRSAGANPDASWTTKRTFACTPSSPEDCKIVLAPRSRLVAATYDVLGVEEQLISGGGFAATGGQLRLVLSGTQSVAPNFQQDLLGYGNATVSLGLPAPAPSAGKSLKRKVSEDGYFVNTNNNADDFSVGCDAPTPGEVAQPVVQPTECADPPDDPQPDPDPPADPPGQNPGPTPPAHLTLELTELLPDPVAPQLDSTDEFVEIYNPNDVEVNLKDYAVKTGSSFQNKVTLGDEAIAAHGYHLVTSGETSLSLVNTGTAVQLVDPSGHILEEAPHYGQAKAGQSWMKDGSGWHWSTSPTPLAVNILSLPPPEEPKPAPAKKAAAKSTTKKVAAAKTTQPKPPKEKPVKEGPKPESTVAKTMPNYWIIAAIAGVAATYGAYEYRKDLRQWGKSTLAKLKKGPK